MIVFLQGAVSTRPKRPWALFSNAPSSMNKVAVAFRSTRDSHFKSKRETPSSSRESSVAKKNIRDKPPLRWLNKRSLLKQCQLLKAPKLRRLVNRQWKRGEKTKIWRTSYSHHRSQSWSSILYVPLSASSRARARSALHLTMMLRKRTTIPHISR